MYIGTPTVPARPCPSCGHCPTCGNRPPFYPTPTPIWVTGPGTLSGTSVRSCGTDDVTATA